MIARVGAALCAALFATSLTAMAADEVAVAKAGPSVDPSVDVTTWSGTPIQLAWDVQHGRPASESTVAHIASDGTYLYVRFDAKQREPIKAVQRTNDVGADTDDEVVLDLWPGGTTGYKYTFVSTPNGTHYQYSSENSAYEPNWESHGAQTSGGYVVTMKIPLSAIRGAGKGAWKANFGRIVEATGESQAWSYGPAQTQIGDLVYAGTVNMTIPIATRPKPRLATYILGTAASQTIGGSTSRTGADISLPITQTASFYATFHPDFSNVELDQQSISPTVFARFYNEVRPFFTQGSGFYNPFDCDACPGINELYTPAIPTPRSGYAVEGKQGQMGFAAFDAVGVQRNDQASALTYRSKDLHWSLGAQRVAVDMPGFHDDLTTTGVAFNDSKHITAYFNYGSDSGTNVAAGNRAQRYDLGGGYYSSTFGIFGGVRKIGDYYNPADGFVQKPGIAGYGLFTNKVWTMPKSSPLLALTLGGFIDRYHGDTGALNMADNTLNFNILTRSLIDINLQSGSSYLMIGNVMTPVTQTGASVTLHSGSQTNNVGCFDCHGGSATPTTISYNTGRYGAGRLDTWTRSSTLRAGTRGTITFDLDDTAQWIAGGTSNVQWFERVGYAYQLGRDSSFAVGLRRVVGTPPNPNGGGNCVGVCSNIALSYHTRLAHSEIYASYGSPNYLSTLPQFLVKMIFYSGADKGT